MESFEQIRQLISSKLTWEIFEEVLKKHHNSTSVRLNKITLGKPAGIGIANQSAIVRFSVEYSGKTGGSSNNYTLHVLSKSLVKNIAHQKTIRNTDFYKNEIVFYEHVWPQLDAFQRRRKSSTFFDSIPKYLHGYIDGKNDYILLEDLDFQSYEGYSRADTLTLDRARLVLKILAHFHALGYAFKETEPELFRQTANKLKETYFHESFRSWYINLHNNLKDITFEAVQKKLPQSYITKFEEIMAKDLYGEASVLCSPTAPTKFKTFTHGDTWMPNILTRHDADRRPVHSIMLDFQLTRYASLAQDLHFFIYACTDADLQCEANYKEMLKFYCEEFNAYVSQLNPQLLATESGTVLTYDALVNELKANGSFALCMSIEARVASLFEDDDYKDIDQIEGEEAIPLECIWDVKKLNVQENDGNLAQTVKHMMDHTYL